MRIGGPFVVYFVSSERNQVGALNDRRKHAHYMSILTKGSSSISDVGYVDHSIVWDVF